MKKRDTLSEYKDEYFFSLTMDEVISTFGVKQSIVVEIVEQGIVEPQHQQKDWLFDSEAIRRIRMAINLHHDLGINMAGAALAIELLEEIEALKKQFPEE